MGQRVLRQRNPKPLPFDLGPAAITKPPKTKKLINADYYKHIKEEKPELYCERRAKQKQASRDYRVKLKEPENEEKLQASRQKALQRVREYRKRQKEKAQQQLKDGATNVKSKIKTRKDAEILTAKREKEKLRKQQERANWSYQKRNAERKKARDRYHQKVDGKTISKKDDSGPAIEDEGNERSANAKYQAVHRVMQALPKTPVMQKETLAAVIKKTGLDDFSAPSTPAFTKSKVKKYNEERVRELLIYKQLTSKERFNNVRKLYGFSKSLLSYYKLKKKKGRGNGKIEAVQNFFQENGRITSEKKHGKSEGETRIILEDTIEELHRKFFNETNISVSRSFFFKSRPNHVKKIKEIKFNQSLCEVCENFLLTCKCLGRFSPIFLMSKNKIINHFLCEKPVNSAYHRKECIDRTCPKCKSIHLTDVIDDASLTALVLHKQWIYKETGRGVRRKVLHGENVELQQCIENLNVHMKHMPSHIFTAQWQYKQFQQLQRNTDKEELVTVMDFAENYRCMMQDEVQAAYWNYEQATIHPMVNYYQCPSCTTMKAHTIVAISNDLQHDHHAVEVFWKENLSIIRGEVEVTRAIQWTDGCGVQYKSKAPFANIQLGREKYGVALERNFFGSRHGKNPSDGVSANVKNKATRAVRCRRACIQNAKDLFLFLQDNMTIASGGCDRHNARTFVFVDREQIKRPTMPTLIPLKGTHGLHVLKSNGDGVLYRNLSCRCLSCKEDEKNCINREYVEGWRRHSFVPTTRKEQPSPQLEEMTENMVEEEEIQASEDQDKNHCVEDLSLSLSTSTLEYLHEEVGEIPASPALGQMDIDMSMPSTSGPTPCQDLAASNDKGVGERKDTLQCSAGSYVAAKLHGVGGIQKVFYGIIRLVVEEGLNKLPFRPCSVTTPTGHTYEGLKYEKGNCGVSIVRSGEAMEQGLRDCCRSIRIGKILIQSDEDTHDAKAVYANLPKDIHLRKVLLMYPIMSTGNTVVKAMKILKMNSVKEENVVLLTLFSTPQAAQKVLSDFPDMRILTTEVHPVAPGHFGQRYFGTD